MSRICVGCIGAGLSIIPNCTRTCPTCFNFLLLPWSESTLPRAQSHRVPVCIIAALLNRGKPILLNRRAFHGNAGGHADVKPLIISCKYDGMCQYLGRLLREVRMGAGLY